MWWPPIEAGTPPLFEVVKYLGAMPMAPGTRLYGDTGTALPLAFYSGLPVQNVMPVRRAFLDGYPGDIVIVEGPATTALTGSEVRQSLTAKGVAIGEPEGLAPGAACPPLRRAGQVAQPRRRALFRRVSGTGAVRGPEAAPSRQDPPGSGGA